MDGTLVYSDAAGDARAVSWARDGGAFAITESRRELGPAVSGTAGPGCVKYQPSDSSATYVCDAAGISAVRIELGDRDDFGEARNTSAFSGPVRYFQDTNFPVTVLAGEGNDEVTGGPAADVLAGDGGDDSLRAGRDEGAGQPELDTISGGPGNDTITDARSADGGEGNDTITLSHAGSTAAAGPGDDSITGGSGADTIDAGDGADSILTGDGGDRVNAGGGDDRIEGGDGDDTLEGGDGADAIDGRAGKDTVAGGDGPDAMDGGTAVDSYSGGGGDDRITADDETAEVVDCGGGANDRVLRWDKGKDRAVPRASCEHVPERGLARRSKVIGYGKAARTGRLQVRFQCIDCEGLKVALQTWQFFYVPNKPGWAMGSNCHGGRVHSLRRVDFDFFVGSIKLTACQRRNLAKHVRLERAGKAKMRRFEFKIATAGGSRGNMDVRGPR